MLQNVTATSLHARKMAQKGRNGDTMMAHVTPGEIVVPKSAQTPEVVSTINRTMSSRGIPMSRYVVGSGDNSINPNTGTQEHFGIKNLIKGAIGGVTGFMTGGPAGAVMGGLSGAFGDEISGGKQSGATTGTPGASVGTGNAALANLPGPTAAAVQTAGNLNTVMPATVRAPLMNNTVSPDTAPITGSSPLQAKRGDDIISRLIEAVNSVRGTPEFYDAAPGVGSNMGTPEFYDIPNNPYAIQEAVNQGAEAPGYTKGGTIPQSILDSYNSYKDSTQPKAVTGQEIMDLAAKGDSAGLQKLGQPASLSPAPVVSPTASTTPAATTPTPAVTPAAKKTITNITQKMYGSTTPSVYGQKNYDGDQVIYNDGSTESYADFFAREIGNQNKGGSDFKSYIGKSYGSATPAAAAPAPAPAATTPAPAPVTPNQNPINSVTPYYEPKYLNEVVGRELGYQGPWGAGGMDAWLAANPQKKAEYDYLLAQRGGQRLLTEQDKTSYLPSSQPAQDPAWLVDLRQKLEQAIAQANATNTPAPTTTPGTTTQGTTAPGSTTGGSTAITSEPVLTRVSSLSPVRSSRFGTRRYKGSLARNF